MFKYRTAPLLIALLLLAARPVLSQVVEPVGDRGDPKKLKLIGCELIGEDEVRHAIQFDWPLQVASTPHASLEAYVQFLRSRLLSAYQQGGFPNATVDVAVAADRKVIEVVIKEGVRYEADRVLVEGNTNGVDTGAIIAALTEVRSEKPEIERKGDMFRVPTILPVAGITSTSKPIWKAGQRLQSGERFLLRAANVVREQMEEQGYWLSDVVIGYRYDGTKGSLLVTVRDPGPRVTLESWRVAGAMTNRVEQIEALLGLKQGMPIGRAEIMALRRKLWDSARFLRHDLLLSVSEKNRSKVTLIIDLMEDPDAADLSKPLSESEQVMVRLSQWLEERRGQVPGVISELEAKWAGLRTRVAASRSGAALVLGPLGEKQDDAGGWPMAGIYWKPGELGITAFGRSFTADPGRANVGAAIEMIPKQQPSPDGTRHSLQISAKIGSDLPGFDGAPVWVSMSAAPVTLMHFLRGKDVAANLEGGVLSVRSNLMQARIDARTGELLEGRLGEMSDAGDVSIRIAKAEEEVESIIKRARELGGQPVFVKGHSLSSFIVFAAHTWVAGGFLLESASPEQRLAAAQVVSRVLTVDALAPMDVIFKDWLSDKKEDRFSIPLLPGQESIYLHLACALDDYFARGTWPWTLAREMLFLRGGQTEHFQQEFARLYGNPAIGPLGSLVIAELYGTVSPQVAGLFARQGLRRMDGEAFATDCRSLLGEDSPAARTLTALVDNFRRLKAQDIAALRVVLPKDVGQVAMTIWEELQKAGDVPPDKALDAALPALWSLVKDGLEKRLRVLANPDA